MKELTKLTVEQSDELVLSACTAGDGAIEDCEVDGKFARYFFESGTVAKVNIMTGEYEMDRK